LSRFELLPNPPSGPRFPPAPRVDRKPREIGISGACHSSTSIALRDSRGPVGCAYPVNRISRQHFGGGKKRGGAPIEPAQPPRLLNGGFFFFFGKQFGPPRSPGCSARRRISPAMFPVVYACGASGRAGQTTTSEAEFSASVRARRFIIPGHDRKQKLLSPRSFPFFGLKPESRFSGDYYTRR